MEISVLEGELTDGVVTLRPAGEEDSEALIAGRDDEFHRFMGDGSPNPKPTAVIMNADRQIIGWIDYDRGRHWLTDDEVNIGYNTFAEHRGMGVARRSLGLLLGFLADHDLCKTATLLIDPENLPSLAVAERAGFRPRGHVDGQLLFEYAVGPFQGC